MNLLVKYPSRSRPDLVRKVLPMYLADVTARVLMSIDADDATMNNPAMLDWLHAQPRVAVRVGDCKSKIEAINDGVAEADFELIVLAADDMVPQRPDYARRIVELFTEHFPTGDGVLHLNDGRAGKTLNTLPICDKLYFGRTKTIYNPAYTSLFADDEFQAVSELLGRSAYVDEVIIKHEWIGDHEPDQLHRHNESFYEDDRDVFERRKLAGFPS